VGRQPRILRDWRSRQFAGPSGHDDDISQLSVTFYFKPEKKLRAIGAGDRWCHSVRELAEFERFILASIAYRAVSERIDGLMKVNYEYVS
jgi:hypothetical protein